MSRRFEEYFVYFEESANLTCPGASESDIIYWRRITLQNATIVASCFPELSEPVPVKLSPQYESRGVNMSCIDGHLHFPKIQLSDEGEYICNINVDAPYYVVDMEVRGMSFLVFMSLCNDAN